MKTILFDLDGTLVDTERLYLEANVHVAAQLGLEKTQTDFLPLVGAAGADEARITAGVVGADNVAAFMTMSTAYVNHELETRPNIALPGAEALLQRLRQAGFKLGVVTSSAPEHLEHVLQNTGWSTLFDWHVTLAHGAPKPAPDLYLHALHQAKATADDAIAVEDTPIGVAAAKAAELPVIQVVDLMPPAPDATVQVANLQAVGDWLLQNA